MTLSGCISSFADIHFNLLVVDPTRLSTRPLLIVVVPLAALMGPAKVRRYVL
jgi:hypothetical protein